MDTLQILLLIVLSLTTLILTIVGIQLIFVLTEAKQTLKNINKIINGLESAGIGLQHGLSEVTGFITGFKSLIKIIEAVAQNKKK